MLPLKSTPGLRLRRLNSLRTVLAAALGFFLTTAGHAVGLPPATHTVTTLADSGPGSLRAAISAAGWDDTIVFQPALFAGALPKTITLTSGELLISRSLTIVGPGDAPGTGAPRLAITANSASRVFRLSGGGAGQAVTISGVSIQRGLAVDGGGIFLTQGSLTLIDCDVVDNKATHHGGGIGLGTGTALTLVECLVANNLALDDGGGVALNRATLIGLRSLFATNNASDQGGAIFNTFGKVQLENCTVSGNTANRTGAIYTIGENSSPAEAVLRACTVAFNDANTETGGIHVSGKNTVLRLAGTIVSGNVLTPSGNPGSASDLLKSSYASVTSQNYNLVLAPGSGTLTPAADDRLGSAFDARLAALVRSGGRTATHALLAGSHALDVIPAAFHPALMTTDQRGDGFARVAGTPVALADIGAWESQAPGVTVSAADIVAECAGALTPVEVTFSATDPDGPLDSIVIRQGLGAVVWTADAAALAAAAQGAAVTAMIQVDHAAHDTLEFLIEARDANHVASASVFVTLVDTTPPVLTLNGPAIVPLEIGTPFVDLGATATDTCGGALSVAVDPAVFVPSQTGLQILLYSATDDAGNTTTATRTVEIVDTTAPVLTVSPTDIAWEATDPVLCGFSADAATFLSSVTVSVIDFGDPAPAVDFVLAAGGGGYAPLAFPHVFEVGTTEVFAFARDMKGNQSAPITILVSVTDKAPPVLTLNGADSILVPLSGVFVDPGSVANDNCDGDVVVQVAVNGLLGSSVDTCRLGSHLLTYSATDSAGNESSVVRTVHVVPPVIDIAVADVVTVSVDPGNCAARRHVVSAADSLTDSLAKIAGLPAGCDGISVATTILEPGASDPVAPDADGTFNFAAGASTVTIVVSADEIGGGSSVIATRTFTVQVANDAFNSCAANLVWKLALDLTGPDLADGVPVSQYLSRPGEARWYKVRVSPGSQVHLVLAGLPADYDVAVYRDIAKTLAQLNNALEQGSPELALLGVEFAAENYAAENYAAENYAAENYAAENYAAENYAAENYAAENYAAENYAAENYAAENYAAENYADANFSAENYAALFAAAENYAAENYAAENYAAENYAAENYAAAQQASLLIFSALPGTIADEIRFNTFSEGGDFYIRVRGKNGAYSAVEGDVFTLFLQVTEDVCSEVDQLDTDLTADELSALDAAVEGDETSLILWDSARIHGSPAERTALQARLAELASATNGAVVDLATIATIHGLNAQADANRACPAAKNLVADAIRNAILAIRVRAPIEDITLVGNDDVIPFFRVPDEALLASEAGYYPPVKGDTHSQSSLRNANVLTQDRYGSSSQVFLTTGPYDLPEIPVGRLVETASQVNNYIAAYLPVLQGPADGVLPLPAQPSVFISGYDFLSDASDAVEAMLVAGLSGVPGGPVINDELVADPTTPPEDSWTATQFGEEFLAQRYDLAFLAGHFSTAGMLAADYTTRFAAARLLEAPFGRTGSLIFSIGCHSGYSTVNEHAVPIVTEQPDWAEAFAQKQAIWISGTGYQYGDTDTVEFGERLYLEFARALGAGNGPVPIGRALVEAKRRYLEDTSVMRGIHEKTLQQVTLYGLPMLQLDLPGATPAPAAPGRGVGAVVGVGTGPGDEFGLKIGSLQFTGPSPTERTELLEVVGTGELREFRYLQGTGDGTVDPGNPLVDPFAGTVMLTGEPVRPLEIFNVSHPGSYARGIGFRSGAFTDLPGRRPLTGAAATEISGVKFKFSTDVLYPIRPWNLNHLGVLGGGETDSRLNLFPGQFISDYLPDGSSAETGTIRRFDSMAFDVFFSPEIDAANQDDLTDEQKAKLKAQFTLAQANAPTANVLTTALDGDGHPIFAVEVAALRAVGVQEVWVTYSILHGNGTGEWRSLTLTPPDEERGIGLWTGILEDPDADLSDGGTLRYFVQAVNGVGVVSLNTNLGRFFRIGESTLDESGGGVAGAAETQLTMLAPVPTEGVYRDSVELRASLLSDGVPVAGKSVAFRIGPLVTTGNTDASGEAVATIVLAVEPGTFPLEAAFIGDGSHAGSASAVSPFTVTKRPTVVTFAATGTILDSSAVAATLTADNGTPLKEKTVLFVIAPTSPAGTPSALAVITDGAGVARLEPGVLPPGAFNITAHFAADVTLADGAVVALVDTLYQSSQTSGAFVLPSPEPIRLTLSKEVVNVTYLDTKAAGSSKNNRGHSRTDLGGKLRFAEPQFAPEDVLSAADAKAVKAHLSVSLSGKTLFDGPVTLGATRLSDRIWTGSAEIAGSRAQIRIVWLPRNEGIVSVTVDTPPRFGPLYKDTPAILECELTFGTGDGENPAKLDLTVGDAARPWTKQQTNQRLRIAP